MDPKRGRKNTTSKHIRGRPVYPSQGSLPHQYHSQPSQPSSNQFSQPSSPYIPQPGSPPLWYNMPPPPPHAMNTHLYNYARSGDFSPFPLEDEVDFAADTQQPIDMEEEFDDEDEDKEVEEVDACGKKKAFSGKKPHEHWSTEQEVAFAQVWIQTSEVTSSSSPGRWTYDVFVSFRGEDTRKNFVDHLYAALDQAGIYTFKDDNEGIRGTSISLELEKAIQESMISVVVLSKNYANSSWCLEELAKIIECRHLIGQRVLPVFYDVDPSDVRGQKRSFHAAFEQHEVNLENNAEKVKCWRDALVTTANLSGWDVSKTASGREAECIKQIVRSILSYTESRLAENLVGTESQIQHVKSLLAKGSRNVSTIGIWGMGGIGKTTIARAVYRQISCEFEGSSFVADVRENGSDNRGLQALQEKLISELVKEKDFQVKDCYDGILQIQRRLSHKKVLLVLDDVDDIRQLEFLAGAHEWFGTGSRIMITTRDEHLLCDAEEKYVPELLEETEAMDLFCRYAFKSNSPPKTHEKLSHDVVSHTGHLPLALKVLGSHFYGRNFDFWQSALNVLARIPHKEINGILKISFDGLNVLEKNIFLYIACFFKGKKRHHVTRILDSLCLEAVSGITVLIEKSLLTISDGYFHMHDLIQEMGWCVVRECYPNNMLWIPDEIKEVMTTTDGLETIEAIVETGNYQFSDAPVACCSAQVLNSMKKLRLLVVNKEFTLSEPTYLPEQLRWLCWSWYPFRSLRITRGMTKLVGLEMPGSWMRGLQIEEKIILPNLKFMDLHASSITNSPDVSGVPNLEKLDLSSCLSLVEVHQSVLLHENIVHLDLSYCRDLKILPSSIHMKSLETLFLNKCANLETFPDISGEMGRLLFLNIDGCGRIRALPSSIRLLTGLIFFTMRKYTPIRVRPNNLHIQGLTHISSLRILDLKQNDLVDDDFPTNLHDVWPSLEKLDLSRNLITCVPPSIPQIFCLKFLDLSRCGRLEKLHDLPPLIQVLRVDNCIYLQKVGDLLNKYKWLFKISFLRCEILLKDEESESHLANMLMKSVVQKCAAVNHGLSVQVPGSKIPNWFSNRRLGDKIPLYLPRNQITNMKGLAICCLFRSHWLYDTSFKIKFKPSGEESYIDTMAPTAKSADHVWIGYMSIDSLQNQRHGFEHEDIVVTFESFHDIVECGVCVVYNDDIIPTIGIGSWIPDYNEMRRNDDYNARDELQHGRWFLPAFSFGTEKYRSQNTVEVLL